MNLLINYFMRNVLFTMSDTFSLEIPILCMTVALFIIDIPA
jgi:hypothetical protein